MSKKVIIEIAVLLTGVFTIIFAVAIVYNAASTGHSARPAQHSRTIKIVNVVQPPSAKVIFAKVGCDHFKDMGPAPLGGVVDHGTCMIGGHKYAIDTFASSQIRDIWLKSAEKFGVSPRWETSISVIYPSIS